MSKHNTETLARRLANNYFRGVYDPSACFIQGVALLHSNQITGIGGEQKLNDANTKVLVGISDFNGKQLPNDFNGLIRGMVFRYASETITQTNNINNPASPVYAQLYSELVSAFPAWLRNSEVVFKIRGIEAIRIRVEELLLGAASDKIPADWSKDFEKTIKVKGGEDLEIFLNTPSGATMDSTKYHFVQLVIYGIKFAPRKAQ